ncbi:MAG: tetratricopeptide repeat protein [Planctomycetia bacterium]|nr:tetratricopeptide repeat protein [Planctomycetia bacterium]
MSDPFLRGQLLVSQGRFDLAESEFRGALARDPGNALAHAFLSLCLSHRDDKEGAISEARVAVGIAPDLPFAHQALGRALLEADRYEEAAAAAGESLRLDPRDENAWALLGGVRIEQRRWAAALEAADAGLAIDPEDASCANVRALALVQLGRRAEAAATMQGALARDPESAVTHANQGWAYLHEGRSREALEHFRESLRLNPDSEWARAGIVEAMKARWWPYRLLLRYFLWAGRMDSRWRIGLFVGLWIGVQFLSRVRSASPEVQSAAGAAVTAWVVFAISTWFASPLFNLVLRLNRFGRHALSAEQTREANWVGIVAGAAVVCAVARYASGEAVLTAAAIAVGGLLFPLVSFFRCPAGWARVVLGGWLALMSLAAAVVCAGVAAALTGSRDHRLLDVLAGLIFVPYVWAAVLTTWIGPIVTALGNRRR